MESRKEQVEWLSTELLSTKGRSPQNPPSSPPSASPLLERVLNRLHGVQGGPHQFTALCPAHHDTRPSLSIGIGRQGQVLLHCFRGCDLQAILNELGIQSRDLFPALPVLANRRRREGE